jgi:hypothetical protein
MEKSFGEKVRRRKLTSVQNRPDSTVHTKRSASGGGEDDVVPSTRNRIEDEEDRRDPIAEPNSLHGKWLVWGKEGSEGSSEELGGY